MNRHLLIFILLITITTALSHLLRDQLALINVALLHLIPIVVLALRGNYTMTLIASLLAVILFNVLYVPPLYSFTVDDAFYLWTFLLFFIVGTIVTHQAKQVQSSKVKEVLLSTLSHDLKTPLSSILGNATLLQEENINQKDRVAITHAIHTSACQMDRLVANLLDSARLEEQAHALKMDWCDLEDNLGVALQEFPQEDARVKSIIAQDLPLFWGDCALIVRLFVNLIDNALKYSPPNESVQVRMEYSHGSFRIRFFNRSTKVSMNDLGSIFDKFYRLDTVGDIQGSGIGLSICKKIVQAHRGSIEAYTRDGGVVFRITLPVSKHPPALSKEGL